MLTTTLLLLFLVIALTAIMLDQAWTEAARLRLLASMAAALRRASTAEEVVAGACTFGERLFAECDGAIYVTRPGSPMVALAGWWGSEPPGRGFCGFRVSTLAFGPDAAPSMVCLRLRTAGETVGVLTLTARNAAETPLCPSAVTFGEKLAYALAFLRLQKSLDHYISSQHQIPPAASLDHYISSQHQIPPAA